MESSVKKNLIQLKYLRKKRIEILPQMEVYDSIISDDSPYTMFRNPANFRHEVCNTDCFGFRWAPYQTINNLSLENFHRSQHVEASILLGASTAFGVGASSDQSTTAGQLNRRSTTPWLNFAHRAHNSFQELLTFLIFIPRSIKINKIVLLSGANNPYLNLYEKIDSNYSPYFFSYSTYKLASTLAKSSQTPIRQKIKSFFKPKEYKTENVSLPDLHSIHHQTRDLEILNDICLQRKIQLLFAFQPIAALELKDLSPEEIEVHNILDQIQGESSIMTQFLSQVIDYKAKLTKFCVEKKIQYLDLQPHFSSNNWLFVDRLHLNDSGQSKLAKIISNYFDEKDQM